MRAKLLGDSRELSDYNCLVIGSRIVFRRTSKVELPSCRMHTLQRPDSVIFGGRNAQTSISNQILIYLQLQEAKDFLLLCLAHLYLCGCIKRNLKQHGQLCLLSILFRLAWTVRVWSLFWCCWSFIWVGYPFCIYHRTPFVSLLESKKNCFDASLAHRQWLSCIDAGFSFLFPTFFWSRLEGNPAANILWDKVFLT